MGRNKDFLWWRDGVIYQIYPRSFMDSNGDGVGDLQGIISKLDYIQKLGVDAIWLCPINVSPMYDFGYDVADYENIDPIFGSLEDFEKLISEAHGRGLKIMMDMPFNHTSHLHSWFQESRLSRENPKANWYIWRDSKAGRRPNNWASVFGGSAWQWEAPRSQFYYHQYLKEQPDLNWHNEEVKAEILRIMKFWLEKGVDGFRLDTANCYIKDKQFRDNPQGRAIVSFGEWRKNLDSNPRTFIPVKTAWQRQTHLYDRDLPEIAKIHDAFRQLLDSYPERCAIGEIGGKRTAAQYVGEGKLHLAYPSALPAFSGYSWHPNEFQESIREQESAYGPEGQPCYFLSNHDIPRHISRYGNDDRRAKVAAAMLLTLRGTPFIYYGEEIGMRQVFIPPWKLKDTIAKRYWPFIRGRDGCRTPMQWSARKNAGFSNGSTWLPIGRLYRKYNVEAEKDDPSSLLSFYRNLIRLRKGAPALWRGTYRALIEKPETVMAYVRETEEQKILVILNFLSRRERISFARESSGAEKWKIIYSNGGKEGALEMRGIQLAPYEVLIAEAW